MKYLKVFEDYKSQTFHEMSDDEINHIYPDESEYFLGKEKFTNTEFEYLQSKYNNVSYGKVKSIISINDSTKLHLRDKKIGNFFVDIEKFKDEWYIIYYGYVTKGKVYHGSEVVSELVWKYKWYKCDQWDGLLDCLNFLINKKVNESHYQKIEQGWVSGDYLNNQDSFTDREINYIREKIEPYVLNIRIDNIKKDKEKYAGSPAFKGYLDLLLKVDEDSKWSGASLFKLSDEWYILSQNHASWKCDQLDGLIQCIKEKVISNK